MIEVWDLKKKVTDNLTDQLLINRGVSLDDESKRVFFKPNFNSDLPDPYLMTGMKIAVNRIEAAFNKSQKIGIFADYDADGVPGAALLYKALRAIGFEAVTYIPDRESGYGLSREGIDYLISSGCELIITIDLGIRSLKEAIYCKEKNIDLIITDHHLPDDQLPDALAVLNPKTPRNKYPDIDLCGCGVAYKLITALSKVFPGKINEQFLKWNLDLVAISTIADVVPLTGENRVLAKYGLLVLNKTRNIGLIELMKISGIDREKVDAYIVGFQIAPRINAPGRIDHATKSFDLLTTEDTEKAKKLALWLNEKNQERQGEMDSVVEEAISTIKKEKQEQNKVIVLSGKWLKGVIGPSASRITELFYRPVILFAEDGSNYVGSARSIEGVNIVELFDGISSTIEKYGGHKGAAGLTITKNKLATFTNKILSYANKLIGDQLLYRKIKIDLEVCLQDLTLKQVGKFKDFEPFGLGNPKPTFALFSVTFSNIRKIGKNQQHLSMFVESEKDKIKAVLFNYESLQIKIDSEKKYDIVCSALVNEWNGTTAVNLIILKVKEHENKK